MELKQVKELGAIAVLFELRRKLRHRKTAGWM